MGQSRSIEISVLKARHKIFNRLCSAYRRAGPNHRADKVSEHVCRLICLCIDYRVSAEILGGDTATGLDRVLANMRIPKKEFDDVTDTYEPIDQIRR